MARKTDRVGKGGGLEHAYAKLRRDIVSLTLKPGAPLDEAALAEELGLSRTPVHAALVRLAAESLVVLSPNRGASVAGLGWNEIRDYSEAYALLLRVTHRWAALRRTDAQLQAIDDERRRFEAVSAAGQPGEMNESNWRFHALIAAASGNAILERDFLHVLTLSMRIAHLAYEPRWFRNPEDHRTHNDKVLVDHSGLLDAIRKSDPEEAEELARRHAELSAARIRETLTTGTSSNFELLIGDPPSLTL